MDRRIKFRTLTPEDIEVRPATIKDGKATLLTYIDSRSVVELMDEAVGPMNWNFELDQVGGQMVGKMGVWDDEKGTWVVKSDTGSESNIEAGKGLVSDIYKRCISRWGLQDLYTVPRIVVDDDGYGCKWSVGEVIWNEKRECIHITLVNKFGKVMYEWNKGEDKPQTRSIQMTAARKDNTEILRDFCTEKKSEEGVDLKELKKFFDYYFVRMDSWKGKLDVPALYQRWLSSAK